MVRLTCDFPCSLGAQPVGFYGAGGGEFDKLKIPGGWSAVPRAAVRVDDFLPRRSANIMRIVIIGSSGGKSTLARRSGEAAFAMK